MRPITPLKALALAPLVAALVVGLTVPAWAAEKTFGPDAKKLAHGPQRAINFLRASQADDGRWTSANSTGVTAVVFEGLVDAG